VQTISRSALRRECPRQFRSRTNAVRTGVLLAVAGRIIRNVACKSSQLKAAAAATANMVAITSVAKCSMAIMTCLPCCESIYRKVLANLNLLINNGLWEHRAGKSVWHKTRRGDWDALQAAFVWRRDKSAVV
jgi:hypothetical protein